MRGGLLKEKRKMNKMNFFLFFREIAASIVAVN